MAADLTLPCHASHHFNPVIRALYAVLHVLEKPTKVARCAAAHKIPFAPAYH
jgi:hypothetical protein